MVGRRTHTGIVVVVDRSLEVGILDIVVVVVVEEYHIHESHGIAGLEKT